MSRGGSSGGGAGGGGALIKAETHADVTFVNTAAQQTLFTFAIPVTVAAGDRCRIRAAGQLLNNSGAGITYTFVVRLGATDVVTSPALAVAQSASTRHWALDAELAVAAPAASQILDGRFEYGDTPDAGWSPNNVTFPSVFGGVAAENLTVAKNLLLLVTMSVANAAASITSHEASLELIPKG